MKQHKQKAEAYLAEEAVSVVVLENVLEEPDLDLVLESGLVLGLGFDLEHEWEFDQESLH